MAGDDAPTVLRSTRSMTDNDPESDSSIACPHPDCDYTSSEQGVKIHYGRTHEGTIGGVEFECAWCSTKDRTDQHHIDRAENNFCSPECRDYWRSENLVGEDAGGWQGGGKTEIECHYCGSTEKKWECHIGRSDRTFCNPTCYGKWESETGIRSGEQNGRWKGGGGRRRYYGPNWHQQRRRAKERDDYCCRRCGMSENKSIDELGRELDVHHLRPLRTFAPLETDDDWSTANALSNLLTLCRRCHREWEGIPLSPQQ